MNHAEFMRVYTQWKEEWEVYEAGQREGKRSGVEAAIEATADWSSIVREAAEKGWTEHYTIQQRLRALLAELDAEGV